jgi:GTP cyclohydrolase IA
MKSNKAVVKVMPPQPKEKIGDGSGGEDIAPLVQEILAKLGEDPQRDGLARTPHRVDQALRFLTSGYRMDIQKILNGALYDVKYDEMVVVKDIEFFSMCEHHMLPFYGKMHVAYLPKNKVIGLSKIPRIVDVFARRLQIQERLTQQVAQTIQEVVDPVGVGVICEARHFCMMMRGVEKQHSGAMTSAMLGAFRSRKETRDEFLALVNHKSNGF